MENVEKVLKESKALLKQKMTELELLEKERDEIVKSFSLATEKEKKVLEKKMKLSIESFKALYDEVVKLNQSIKNKLKKYC